MELLPLLVAAGGGVLNLLSGRASPAALHPTFWSTVARHAQKNAAGGACGSLVG